MNAVKEGDQEAQVNAIFRTRHWCEVNDFRALKPSTLNDLFLSAKLALYEEHKFLQFIGQDNWPTNMETTRENLLRTTTHDSAIEENKGNTTDILPVI